MANSKRPETDFTDDIPQTDKPVAPAVSVQEADAPLEASGLDVETATALQTSGTGRSVARATAGMMPLYIARFIFGFLAQPLIARNLGLSKESEAYAVATDILQRIWLIFEKVLNPAVLPCFIRAMKEEGEERAWRFASTVFWITIIALTGVTALAFWQMPNIIIRGYSHKSVTNLDQIALTISLSRTLLIGLFFLGLSSLTYVLLNGYKRFVVAALGDTLWKLGLLGGAVVALGAHMSQSRALETIAVGFLVGAFFKLFPQVLALGRKWKFLRPRIDLSDPLTRKMFALCIPLMVGILVSETRGIYLQRLADSPLIEAVSAGRAALKWSRTIGDSLVQIFPYALSIGIFPYLADLARERDRQPLTDTLMGALRVCIFVFGPLTLILIALRFPLLRAVWEGGKFTQDNTIAISGPFVGFTIGLIAFSCEMILNQTFYAMTNAWTPTLMGLASSVLWVIIATLGVQNGMGLTAIAASEAISKTVKCLLMWILLRPHLGDVRVRENLIFLAKVLGGSILAAAVAWAVAEGIAPSSTEAEPSKIKMLLAVAAAGMSGVLFYIVLGAAAGVQEVRAVIAFAAKLRKRLARA